MKLRKWIANYNPTPIIYIYCCMSFLITYNVEYMNRKNTDMKNRTLGDYDLWYKPCERCGYDTGKSTKPKEGNKTCWKCGNYVKRDYSDRALKKR